MSDTNTKPEPQNFGDLKMQPTGSGAADLESAYMEAALEGGAADASLEAEIADESAAYEKAATNGDDADREGGAQPV